VSYLSTFFKPPKPAVNVTGRTGTLAAFLRKGERREGLRRVRGWGGKRELRLWRPPETKSSLSTNKEEIVGERSFLKKWRRVGDIPK